MGNPTNQADTIYGSNNPDIIHALGGNDSVYGNAGNDSIAGDAGNDTLYGDYGDDKIYGGEGNDELWGGTGNNYMSGQQGNDQLRGGDSADTYIGGEGDDTIYSNDGFDNENLALDTAQYKHGIGNYTVSTSNSYDKRVFVVTIQDLNGNEGKDTLYNIDILKFGGKNYFWTGQSWGAKQITSLNDDNVILKPGNNYLNGYGGNDQLRGSIGNDVLLGERGDDKLVGGDGNDTLIGGRGNDRLHGDGGNDLIIGDDGGFDTLRGGDGNDKINFIEYHGDGRPMHGAIYGDAGSDIIHAHANNGTNTILGGEGNDIIRSGGDAIISGGEGNDAFIIERHNGVPSDILIKDLTVGTETIDVSSLFSSYSEMQSQISESQGNTIISDLDSHVTITLNNIHASDLSASDFTFG
ncbi:MAG: calcium-binding protein [Rickettsiales bacterium]